MTKNPSVESELQADDPAVRAWDQYWQDGRLASCGGAGGAAYQSAISGGARAFFNSLPEGSRILDVCTGNGAIARVAEDVALARDINFSIDAFDSALIAPGASAGRASMITFRSRVMAESLPYDDDSFDAVVSQYGLEYTALDRSLPELARSSAPGCRIRLMVHAAEGVVVEAAGLQLVDARQVSGSGIFEAARTLAQALHNGLQDQPLRALKDRYTDTVRHLEKAAADSVEPEIYANICGVLTYALSAQEQVGVGPVLNKIHEAVETVRAHESRLNAMQNAALDDTAARSLGDRVAGLWRQEISVEAGRRQDGALLGWVIESRV